MNDKTEGTIAANTKAVAWLVLISAILWNIGAWLTWDSTFIMNDGVQYLSTATNWLHGQGFSTNALIYTPHFQGQLPAPQTVWPPGLPMLLVPAGWLGIELRTAALVINLSATALSGLLVFLILRRCGVSQLFALSSAAIFYFTTTSWHLAVALLSEPVFTCLILAAVYSIPQGGSRQHYGRWLLCGLFVAACIVMRYSGIFTAASFGLGLSLVFLFSRCYQAESLWKKIQRLCLFIVLPVIAFAALMLRTQLLVGSVERDTGVGSIKSLGETIRTYATEASLLTGFKDGGIFSGDVDSWLFYLFVLLVAVICLVSFILFLIKAKKEVNTHADDSESAGNGCYSSAVVAVLVAHAAAFGGYLAWCSLSSSPLNITIRYLYQIYPGVFVVFCLLVNYAFAKSTKLGIAKVKTFLKIPVGMLIAMYLVAQVNMIPVIKEYAVRSMDSRDFIALKVDGDTHVADIIRSCVGERASPNDSPPTALWSNSGIQLHSHTGVHTITLAQIYATTSFDFDRFKADMTEYNIKMFVFFNDSFSKDGDYALMLSSIKKWLADEQYPKLQLLSSTLESGTTVDVFAVDGECFNPV